MRRAAVIYGASSDLCRGLDIELLKQGYDVGLTACSRMGELESRAQMLQQEFPDSRVAVFQLDAHNPKAMEESVAFFQSQFEQVAGFINFVGKMSVAPLSVLSDEEWTSCLDLNLSFGFRAVRAWIPAFSKQKYGRMVLVSTLAARGARNLGAYGITKSALSTLARVTALEYANRGISCNVIEPGIFDTPSVREWMSEERLNAWAENSPGRRLGRPADLHALAKFLLTAEILDLNGAVIPIASGVGQL